MSERILRRASIESELAVVINEHDVEKWWVSLNERYHSKPDDRCCKFISQIDWRK